MSRRTRRQLDKISSAVADGLEAAKAYPVPESVADLERQAGIYDGDMYVLIEVYRLLFDRKNRWLKEDGPAAMVLKRIAVPMVEWSERVKDESPSPAEQVLEDLRRNRETLNEIGWIMAETPYLLRGTMQRRD